MFGNVQWVDELVRLCCYGAEMASLAVVTALLAFWE